MKKKCPFCRESFNSKYLKKHIKNCKCYLKISDFVESNPESTKREITLNKCSKCSKESFLLTSLKGKNYCHMCNNFKILEKKKSLSKAYQIFLKSYDTLESAINHIEDFDHFFYSMLQYREKKMKKILSFVYLDPSNIETWFIIHILIKFCCLKPIGIRNNFDKKKSYNFSSYDSIIKNKIVNFVKAIRLIYNLENNEIILAEDRKESFKIYFTSNKYHSLSSSEIAFKILEDTEIKNIFQGFDLIGIVNNSLSEYNSLDTNITESIKYRCLINSMGSIFHWIAKKKIVGNIYFSVIFEKIIEILENGNIADFYPYQGMIVLNNIEYELLKNSLNSIVFSKNPLDSKPNKDLSNRKKLVDDFFSFFSDETSYHQAIFNSKDTNYIIGFETFKFFLKILKYGGEYWDSKKSITMRNRGKRLEKEMFHLISHLKCTCWFSDNKPMLNIYPNDDEKKNEIMDIAFFHDNILEIVQIKSDFTLNNIRMEKYLNKLRKDRIDIEIECQKRNLNFKSYKMNLLIPISHQLDNEVKIFLNPLHFFEYFSRHLGLINWGGDRIFDQYPILAKIAWLTKFPIIDLEPFINNSGAFLLQGCFKDSHFYTGSDFQIDSNTIQRNPFSNYCVLIWDSINKKIIDLLWLPPYWESLNNDTIDFFENSINFNQSSEGQRFLKIAILVGVFGYCPNCFFSPLIPYGGYSKPCHDSVKVSCVICNYKNKLDKYASSMFPSENRSENEIAISLRKRYSFF